MIGRTMSDPTRQRGFTLLEVLIALAIVATTYGGVLALIRGAIDNQDYLERRLFATWVADNVINAYRLEPGAFEGNARSGEETVLSRHFTYRLTVEPAPAPTTTQPNRLSDETAPLQRVAVTVVDDSGAALATRWFDQAQASL